MKASLQDIRDRMPVVLQDIRDGMPAVLDGLENTLYAAAKEVRLLKRVGSGDYADAILDQNGFGGNTAEIYFYRFAPRGSPSDRVEYQTLLSDLERSKAYEKACYQKWVLGINAVQRVLQKYSGGIEVNDLPLADYLREVDESGEVPVHRVHVKISMHGQEKLRKLRDIVRE